LKLSVQLKLDDDIGLRDCAAQQTKSVLRGYLSLNSQQCKELADVIEKERGNKIDEGTIRKNEGISMGPSGPGCPCCGR
jgi:hypothetical protein